MLVQVPPGAMPGTLFTVTIPQQQQQPVMAQPMMQAPQPQYGMPPQQQQAVGYMPQPVMAQPVMAQPITPAPPQPPQYGTHAPQQQAQYTGAMPPLMQPSGMAAPLLAPVPMGMNEPLHVPMGRPVSELMPQVAPVSSLTDSYSNFQYTAESSSEAGKTHAATWDAKSGITDAASFSAPVPMGQPVFYSDEQMALLNQQPPPPEIFYYGLKSGVRPDVAQPLPTVTGAAIATDAHVAMARPVLTTASGVPVVVASSAGLSGARTAFDGMQGIKSCDERLQTSVDELLLFFNTHNSRPLVGCAVEGWHHETRHRRVRVEDGDGKHHYKTETYVEKVTDFQYKIDLTSFVYPFGYIVSVDENKLSVPQLCQKFVDDKNLLKSLQMKKEVHFDFKQLHAMVYGYIRSLGWRRGLTVSFPQANNSVRVYNENMLSEMWENCCCNCLMHVTIVPCILMRLYRGDCPCQTGHAESDIRSYFRINYAPIQVFAAIQNQLWCPGFSGMALAMEILRNVFW